jgi:hypothetical protein
LSTNGCLFLNKSHSPAVVLRGAKEIFFTCCCLWKRGL